MSIHEHVIGVRRRRRARFGVESLDLLPEPTKQALDKAADRVRVWPGQVLLSAGAPVNWVFIVLDGELGVRVDGDQEPVIRAGCAYGALEAVGRTLAPGDLVARDVTEALVLPVQAYKALAETDPHFGYWILRAVAKEANHENVPPSRPRPRSNFGVD